jgi:transcriptional regulator with XRE-family HTH domain
MTESPFIQGALMDVGSSIRLARLQARLNQEELAALAGINRTYLSQLENGHSSPTLDVLARVAKALGIETTALISQPHAARASEPSHETIDSETIYPGLLEFLNDERNRLLMNPTPQEIEELKRIRFLGSHRPSKQFFIDALFEYRRSRGN